MNRIIADFAHVLCAHTEKKEARSKISTTEEVKATLTEMKNLRAFAAEERKIEGHDSIMVFFRSQNDRDVAKALFESTEGLVKGATSMWKGILTKIVTK